MTLVGMITDAAETANGRYSNWKLRVLLHRLGALLRPKVICVHQSPLRVGRG